MPYHGVLCIELKVLGNEYQLTVPAFVVPDSEYCSTGLLCLYGPMPHISKQPMASSFFTKSKKAIQSGTHLC